MRIGPQRELRFAGKAYSVFFFLGMTHKAFFFFPWRGPQRAFLFRAADHGAEKLTTGRNHRGRLCKSFLLPLTGQSKYDGGGGRTNTYLIRHKFSCGLKWDFLGSVQTRGIPSHMNILPYSKLFLKIGIKLSLVPLSQEVHKVSPPGGTCDQTCITRPSKHLLTVYK
jgi:hypothetical protein